MTNYDMDELRRQGKIPKELEKKSDEQKRIYQDYKKLREDKKNDRFDLEEAITSIWQTEDDLDTVLYAIMDAHTDEPPSNDEIVNMLLGIKELHGARMQRLSDIFEDFVKSEHNEFWRHQNKTLSKIDEGNYEYLPQQTVSIEEFNKFLNKGVDNDK